jgi:hypothetical protein
VAAAREAVLSRRRPRWGPAEDATVWIEEHGITGYCSDPQRRYDCLRPAIATVLQVPPARVPDLGVERAVAAAVDPLEFSLRMWDRLERWLHERGLTLTFHDRVPRHAGWWIAVCALDATTRDGVVERYSSARPSPRGPFASHCLVMYRDRRIFDPAMRADPPPGMRVRRWGPETFRYGISFDPI